MARFAVSDATTWLEATRARPCPCCGATTRCAILDGGEFVRCFENMSQWPVITGGWLHRAAAVELAEPMAVTA